MLQNSSPLGNNQVPVSTTTSFCIILTTALNFMKIIKSNKNNKTNNKNNKLIIKKYYSF